MRVLVTVFVMLMLGACSKAPAMLAACDPNTSDRICGIQNGEDLVRMPGTDWFVFSEMLADGDPENILYGSLAVFNTKTGERITLYGGEARLETDPSKPLLGDANCPGTPDPRRFGGHGIDVRKIEDGTLLLAAVNHGDRESIELFSIDKVADRPAATWRGCVLLDRESLFNDVAITGNGELYFTRFISAVHPVSLGLIRDYLGLFFGGDTGEVFHWSQEEGIQAVANSTGSAPNGIAITPEDDVLFVAEWGNSAIYKLDLSQNTIARHSIPLQMSPDNFSWTVEGDLLITGQFGDVFENASCIGQENSTTCDIRYGVDRLDPDTLSITSVFTGIGAASVALKVSGQTYVGSYAGDNLEIR